MPLHNEELSVVSTATFEITQKLKALNLLIPSNELDIAIDTLMSYRERVYEQLSSPPTERALNRAEEIVKLMGLPCVRTTLDEVTELTISGKYTFRHTASDGDDEDLNDFLKFALRDLPGVVDIDVFKSNNLDLESYREAIRIINNNAEVRRHSMIDKIEAAAEPATIISIDLTPEINTTQTAGAVKLTNEQIEAEKQASVAKLKAVHAEITGDVKQKKEAKDNFRIGEIADAIGGCRSDVDKIRPIIEAWLSDMSNDNTYDLFGLVKHVVVKSDVNYPMLIRLMIHVCYINFRNQLKQVPKLQPTDLKKLHMSMATSDKEMMVGVALENFDIVRAHRTARSYGHYQLTLYIIDMCHKSSSLTICETPDEIATLAEGMYNILLSKNLEGDSVYAISVNNGYDVDDVNWFRKNVVIKAYFDYITEGCIQLPSPVAMVNSIAEIFNNRDTTMSVQSIDTTAARQMMKLVTKLPYLDNGTHIGCNDNTIIIGGLYPCSYSDNETIFREAMLIASGQSIAIFVETIHGGLTQTFYNPIQINNLSLWLMYFLPNALEKR